MFRSLRTTLLIAFAFVLISPTAAKAELTIAVVDVDYVMSQSSAAKSIKKQVEKKHESFMDKVREEEKKLLADKKEIESKSKEDISREDLMKKMQEYEKKRFEARKSIQEKKSKLDNAYNEAMNELTKVIYEVCQSIADEQNIDLVITRQNIIVGNMSLDITKEVAEKMNKKLPKVTLEVK